MFYTLFYHFWYFAVAKLHIDKRKINVKKEYAQINLYSAAKLNWIIKNDKDELRI